MMSKRKFILLSILKTWFFATIISVIILVIYLKAGENPYERPRYCDMSVLSYAILIFWILSLSIVSFSSLLSLLKPFQKKAGTVLCWFLLPGITAALFFIGITDGRVDKEGIQYFLISNLPWFILWGWHYYRFTIHKAGMK